MNKKIPKDVSTELENNLSDLRNKVLKESDIDIIASQTGLSDKIEIERVLIENGNDVSSAIIAIMSLKEEPKKKREPTVFDQVREILADKEKVYYQIMEQNKCS